MGLTRRLGKAVRLPIPPAAHNVIGILKIMNPAGCCQYKIPTFLAQIVGNVKNQ